MVISFVSRSKSSLTDPKPRFVNNGLAGASNALLLIILTAPFCSFQNLFMSDVLQHPQTEWQYRKCGSVILIYKFFNIYRGRNCFACFSVPMTWGTSILYPRASFKSNAYQSENQDTLFLLHFGYLCHVFSCLVHLITFNFSDGLR